MRGKNLITRSIRLTEDRLDKKTGVVTALKGDTILKYSYAVDFTQTWDDVKRAYVQVTPEQAEADRNALLALDWVKPEEDGTIRVSTEFGAGEEPWIYMKDDGRVSIVDKLDEIRLIEMTAKAQHQMKQVDAMANAYGIRGNRKVSLFTNIIRDQFAPNRRVNDFNEDENVDNLGTK